MKEQTKAINWIKKNIDKEEIVIDYHNQQEWIITTREDMEKALDEEDDVNEKFSFDDDNCDYIPYIALFLQECVRKGVDISKITIESA